MPTCVPVSRFTATLLLNRARAYSSAELGLLAGFVNRTNIGDDIGQLFVV